MGPRNSSLIMTYFEHDMCMLHQHCSLLRSLRSYTGSHNMLIRSCGLATLLFSKCDVFSNIIIDHIDLWHIILCLFRYKWDDHTWKCRRTCHDLCGSWTCQNVRLFTPVNYLFHCWPGLWCILKIVITVSIRVIQHLFPVAWMFASEIIWATPWFVCPSVVIDILQIWVDLLD